MGAAGTKRSCEASARGFGLVGRHLTFSGTLNGSRVALLSLPRTMFASSLLSIFA